MLLESVEVEPSGEDGSLTDPLCCCSTCAPIHRKALSQSQQRDEMVNKKRGGRIIGTGGTHEKLVVKAHRRPNVHGLLQPKGDRLAELDELVKLCLVGLDVLVDRPSFEGQSTEGRGGGG